MRPLRSPITGLETVSVRIIRSGHWTHGQCWTSISRESDLLVRGTMRWSIQQFFGKANQNSSPSICAFLNQGCHSEMPSTRRCRGRRAATKDVSKFFSRVLPAFFTPQHFLRQNHNTALLIIHNPTPALFLESSSATVPAAKTIDVRSICGHIPSTSVQGREDPPIAAPRCRVNSIFALFVLACMTETRN
jgi:hypothetical protein